MEFISKQAVTAYPWMQFKAAAKAAKSTTLVVRNDRANVPDALLALRAFLSRNAVGDVR